MAANTTIQLKKSSTPSAVPSSLATGEIAINYADGKLYYKNATNHIVEFSPQSTGNYFGSVDADGTLVIADTSGDVLSLVPGSGITIVGDAINDTITISATGTSGASVNVGYNPPPAGNTAGNLWWNSNTGRLYVFYTDTDSSQWVDASPGILGQTGPAGNVTIGTITTLSPNTPPTVSNSGNGAYAILDFGLPRPNTVQVGTTTTLSPGSAASVTNGGTAADITLNFSIPLGNVGNSGPMGPKAITIPIPQTGDEYSIFYTDKELTVANVITLTLSQTASWANSTVRANLYYSADRTDRSTPIFTMFSSGNTIKANSQTTYTNATIPANNFVWVRLDSVANSPLEYHMSLIFTS